MLRLTLRSAVYQLSKFKADNRGQDLIEYALLVASLSLIAFGMFPSSYTPALSNIWGKVHSVMFTLTGSA